MENFWDFSVWSNFNIIAILLLSLLGANVLKKSVKFLQASLIPASVIGGCLLLVVSGIYKLVTDGGDMFDTEFFGGNGTASLEILTYHMIVSY